LTCSNDENDAAEPRGSALSRQRHNLWLSPESIRLVGTSITRSERVDIAVEGSHAATVRDDGSQPSAFNFLDI
jgi:hypothetical protein